MAKHVILTSQEFRPALEALLNEQKRRTKFFWKQRNGELIDIALMDDIHLSNTIAMLENKSRRHEMAWEAMT